MIEIDEDLRKLFPAEAIERIKQIPVMSDSRGIVNDAMLQKTQVAFDLLANKLPVSAELTTEIVCAIYALIRENLEQRKQIDRLSTELVSKALRADAPTLRRSRY